MKRFSVEFDGATYERNSATDYAFVCIWSGERGRKATFHKSLKSAEKATGNWYPNKLAILAVEGN